LEASNWNISQTAKDIDMQRSNLYAKLEKFDMKKEGVE
jgi:transcriptional regulator of acetoin/glycerol metabolism